MCGRYTLSTKDFSKHYGVEQGAFEFAPSYNVAPTQNVPVVLERGLWRVAFCDDGARQRGGRRTCMFDP